MDIIHNSETDKNFEWFVDNYDWISKKYDGNYVAIYDKSIVANGDTLSEVYDECVNSKNLKCGTFIIQECKYGERPFEMIFNRVSFRDNKLDEKEFSITPEIVNLVIEAIDICEQRGWSEPYNALDYPEYIRIVSDMANKILKDRKKQNEISETVSDCSDNCKND